MYIIRVVLKWKSIFIHLVPPSPYSFLLGFKLAQLPINPLKLHHLLETPITCLGYVKTFWILNLWTWINLIYSVVSNCNPNLCCYSLVCHYLQRFPRAPWEPVGFSMRWIALLVFKISVALLYPDSLFFNYFTLRWSFSRVIRLRCFYSWFHRDTIRES